MAQAIVGTTFAGLTALAVGTAAPAGAQQFQPAKQAVSSAAPQHAAFNHGCGYWDDDDCDWWDGGGWDNWNGGWHRWNYWYGW